MADRIDTPRARRRGMSAWVPRSSPDAFGKFAEAIARFMGTPRFLFYLTLFCIAWVAWNSLAPDQVRFDSSEYGFTALTLVLSLQASYAAPLILLAQNRQTDRDRVSIEQDRQRAERALADTEFLAREVAALRLAVNDVATRDFVRSELRNLLDELITDRVEPVENGDAAAAARPRKKRAAPKP